MADTIDQMDDRNEALDAAKLAAIRARATIVPGVPGDCDRCGEPSERLVGAACAPCRDKYKLP